jgi:hypothetical protein
MLMGKPCFERIDDIIESVVGRENKLLKKFWLYASYHIVGFTLKDTGSYYQMKGSAGSQSGRRFREKITKDEKLRQIEKEIGN